MSCVEIWGFVLCRKERKMKYQKNLQLEGWHLCIIFVLTVVTGSFLGFFLGDLLRSKPVPKLNYEIFKDVLFANLAISSLFVALLGFGIYQSVKQSLYKETTRDNRRFVTYIFSNIYLMLSHLHWVNSDPNNQKEHYDPLESAIDLAKEGVDNYQEFLDENDLKSLGLYCALKNNWGYFLSESERPENLPMAQFCAEYLKRHIHKFPNDAAAWEHTIKCIKKKCLSG